MNPIDPYFKHAWKSLERQVNGITDSAITSNAWKPWFRRALKARPEFESEDIPGDLSDCDACNITKRYSPHTIELMKTCNISRSSNRSKVWSENVGGEFCTLYDLQRSFLQATNLSFTGIIMINNFWTRKILTTMIAKTAISLKLTSTGNGLSGNFVIVCPLMRLLIQGRAEIAHYFYHWRYNLREQVKTALRHINYLSQEKKNYIRNLPSDLQDQ